MYFKNFFKKTHLLILLMAIIMPWQMKAQETHTVCDGTTTSSVAPIKNGGGSQTEFIYPASMLDEMEGGTITSVKFFASTASSSYAKKVTVFVEEVANTTENTSAWQYNQNTATKVYEGTTLAVTNSELVIEFDEPYDYNGGNLCFNIWSASDTPSVSYYGENQSYNACGYDYYVTPPVSHPYSSGLSKFLPKAEFTYEAAGGGGCAKPKNFSAEGVSAYAATLTWTAGGDGQENWDVYVTTTSTDVPDENTNPTYQVTECNKELTSLTAQTTYYAYVRAVCSDTDKSKWASTSFTTTRVALTVDADHPYSQNFETENDWAFTNGSLTNTWCWGSATNNGGEKAIYVSKDGGTTYEYDNGSTTVVFASKLLNFANGTYAVTFDWKANGEVNSSGTHYDYLRVALVPGDVEFTAGTSLPSGLSYNTTPATWIALDGGHQLDVVTEWQSQTAEVAASGTYTMIFMWRNDSSGGNQPPAAIDNINISFMTCPRPTGLQANNVTGRTATVSWTENGTAANWVLQYAKNSAFTEDLEEVSVSGNPSKELTGLTPETKYYIRVKSVLGEESSSWSDVEDFTTTATCEKPQLNYVTYSNTAHTGTVSWTGDADNYELIYSTKYSFEPGDDDVFQVNLGNVNTYTLQDLAPETTYRIKVRANCGDYDGYSQWSNQVSFTTTATCVAPSGLSATATSNTVTLTWTAGADGQDAWDIRYKTGSDDYTYIHIDNHAATSYTIQNMSPATTYSVNVRAYCDSEDQSKWGYSTNQSYDLSVTTECAAITVPYTCDFEGAVETSGHFSSYPVPKCWDRIEYATSSYPVTYYPYIVSSDSHNGSKCLKFYKYSSTTNETIILPAIDDSYDMKDLQVRFWAKTNSTNQKLQVGVMEGTSFAQVDEINVANSTYAEFTVFFDGYEGTGRNIAIKCGSYQYSIYYYIDDVTVELAPTCRIPKNLEATVNSDSQATLTWTAGKDETAWNVQFKQASATNWGEMFEANATTYTIDGLKRATAYDARVRAMCSTDDQSDWIETSFTTDCGVWPIDINNALFDDFEDIEASDFPPICWEKFKYEMSGYSYWYLNSNNGLGSSAAYSSYNSGYAFLVLPKMHINGDVAMSFDYLIGSGDYDGSCSVVVSTGAMTYAGFDQTVWTADGIYTPEVKASATISLSGYNGQEIYVAFKFKGSGTSGCTWYVDNVKVYNTNSSINSTVSVGYGTGNGNWQLISSPLAGTISADDVVNMTNCDFDLYRFNQDSDEEWENWKTSGGHYHFDLKSGRGYLYANRDNQKITFVGAPYSGNGEVALTKKAGARFSGWNLIGNPYVNQATVDKEFYRMNSDGTTLIAATDNVVGAMEGIMVYAASDGEIATFDENSSKRAETEQIVIDLSYENGDVIDRVVVRLGDGGTLPKYSFGNNDAKVYVPQRDDNYAVVRSNASGNIPVNFNTNKTGNYTFSFTVETVNAGYLHLIDKLTGDDIDMLKENSYAFVGSPRDIDDRFVLCFDNNGPSTGSGTEVFAYQYGDKIIVSGEGELQIFDVMGRMVSTYRVSGVETVEKPSQNGVYILKLNGKTQKIVVK